MAKPIVDAEYLKEIEKARRDLRALISSKNCAPIMLRLAYSLSPSLSYFFLYEIEENITSTKKWLGYLDILVIWL